MRWCVCVCACACMYACVCLCVCACVRACLHLCVCVSVSMGVLYSKVEACYIRMRTYHYRILPHLPSKHKHTKAQWQTGTTPFPILLFLQQTTTNIPKPHGKYQAQEHTPVCIQPVCGWNMNINVWQTF